jgi:hypothetical protein
VCRVEYDDGDMGWVADLGDASKVKMVDERSGTDAPPLMTTVATTTNVHATRSEGPSDGGVGDAERATAVKFTSAPSAEFPAAPSISSPHA